MGKREKGVKPHKWEREREREREREKERDLTMKDEEIQNKNPEFQLILGQSTIVTSFDWLKVNQESV